MWLCSFGPYDFRCNPRTIHDGNRSLHYVFAIAPRSLGAAPNRGGFVKPPALRVECSFVACFSIFEADRLKDQGEYGVGTFGDAVIRRVDGRPPNLIDHEPYQSEFGSGFRMEEAE